MSEQSTPAAFTHTTVLLHETVDGAFTTPAGIYVDGTFGRGGHSRLLLSRLGEEGRLIAIDEFEDIILFRVISSFCRTVRFAQASFFRRSGTVIARDHFLDRFEDFLD